MEGRWNRECQMCQRQCNKLLLLVVTTLVLFLSPLLSYQSNLSSYFLSSPRHLSSSPLTCSRLSMRSYSFIWASACNTGENSFAGNLGPGLGPRLATGPGLGLLVSVVRWLYCCCSCCCWWWWCCWRYSSNRSTTKR